MIRFCTVSSIISLFIATSFAGPKIEFDTKAFNCGTAIEGVTEKIHATFVVKNIGDSVLKLTNVKPGCGCTVVKYDSIILPGKSTKIESEVNIKGYHSGPLSKFINVFSNAGAEPTRITIDAVIQAAIDASENYIRFDPTNMTSRTIFLTSKKNDLKVASITFNTETGGDSSKRAIKIPVPFKYTPTDSLKADGGKVFKLEITPPKFDATVYGDFVIVTNHPDRKEMNIRGMLSK
jgi:hypothetical protein